MPTYIGNGQPQATNSFWSGLTSWFGGGSGAPVYKPAPSSTPSASLSTSSGWGSNANSVAAQPQVIAIVVPHGFFPAWACPDPQQQ